jgi:LysM repeat protein
MAQVGGDGLVGRARRLDKMHGQAAACTRIPAARRPAVKIHHRLALAALAESLQQDDKRLLVIRVVQRYLGHGPNQVVSIDQVRHTAPAFGEKDRSDCIANLQASFALPLAVLSSPFMGSVRRSTGSSPSYWRYLALNVLVSAFTILVVLAIWGGRRGTARPTATPTIDAEAMIASVIPTLTPTLPPTPTPRTYTVGPGDTLFSIALDLDVSADLLMEANGLNDPDRLSVGQVLIVPEDQTPVPGAPTATPHPITLLDTAIPEAPVEPPKVEIAEVNGAGVLDTEAVFLLNSGGTAAMAGWTLDDGEGQVYRFPDFTLHGGAVSVHTKAGVNTVIDLYWGLDHAVWTSGKVITLRDAEGNQYSTFKIP